MVEYVDNLHEVQDKTYEQPTVLVAGQVCGCGCGCGWVGVYVRVCVCVCVCV